jgi:hypothetical protein
MPEEVEQVGHNQEEGLLPAGPAVVSDGRGKVSLATAVAALENKPVLWLLGKPEGGPVCRLNVHALVGCEVR